MTSAQRVILGALAVVTVALALIGVVVGATAGSNRWLGDDPMLGEFALTVLPVVTAATGLVLWRRWK